MPDATLAAPPGIDPASPVATAEAPAPVAAGERILALDVLRGVALLGVLIANVSVWFSGMAFVDRGARLSVLTVDSAVYQAISILVNGKAVTVFSFLFGVGFAVQMARSQARGTGIARAHLRRLGVLLCFGAAHAWVVWYGDILHLYAVTGVLLLVARAWRGRTLLVTALALTLGVPTVLAAISLLADDGAASAAAVASTPSPASALPAGGGTSAPSTSTGATTQSASAPSAAGAAPAGETAAAKARRERREMRARMLVELRSAEPARVRAANVAILRTFYASALNAIFAVYVIGIFLLGLWAGRSGVLARAAEHAGAVRRLGVVGLAAGMPLAIGDVVLRSLVPTLSLTNPLLGAAAVPLAVAATMLLATGYVCTALEALARPRWSGMLAAFSPVGRMALTNYLAQSLVCVAVFYGLGLVGTVRQETALAISLALFAAQVATSHWWLARFRFGPAEWLWRSLTYGRAQPMRVATHAEAPAPAA